MRESSRLGYMVYHSVDRRKQDWTSRSFWCLDRLATDIGEQTMRLKFVGFHSIAAYNEDRQPVTGAVKEYMVQGAEFMTAIMAADARCGSAGQR